MARRTTVLLVVLLLVPGVAAGAPGTVAHGGTVHGSEPVSTANDSEDTLSIHVISVGQGKSVLVVAPGGETALIDSGDYLRGGEAVYEYLRARGIDRIDHLVATHNHGDHVGGHAELVRRFEREADGVGAAYGPGIPTDSEAYQEFRRAADEFDVPVRELRAGDDLPLPGVDVRVLSPPRPYLADGNVNENSVVLKLERGDVAVLLPGDAEEVAEGYLIHRHESDLEATALVLGHHGGESSTSPDFLEAVSPQVAVVSSFYYASEFPHQAVLERLEDRSVATYWTGVHGTVVLSTDGHDLRIATQRRAPTRPRQLRSIPPALSGSPAAATHRLTLPVGTLGDAASVCFAHPRWVCPG